jgi:outer membrane protein assembly factor BamE (lipoprotein component of BamABCDE complex)
MKIALIKKPMIIISSILVLSLSCQSCFPFIPTTTTRRGPVDDEALSFLRVGTTTKEDILLEFGNPTNCYDNEKTFRYCWTIAYGMCIFLPIPISKSYCFLVEFDEQGILKKYEGGKGSFFMPEYAVMPDCR